MKLYLIRHAESEANAASDLDNPTYYYDARITQRGVEQAKKLNNRRLISGNRNNPIDRIEIGFSGTSLYIGL